MLDVKVRNKEVKSILSGIFGSKNVSVKNGKGTSWGWCHINIYIKNENCVCKLGENQVYSRCFSCKQKENEAYDKAQEALKNVEFFSYSDDMNYSNKESTISTHII